MLAAGSQSLFVAMIDALAAGNGGGQRMRPRVASASSTASDVPVEEVVRMAELGAALRRSLRPIELRARAAGLTPRQYLLLLMVKGAPDLTGRASVHQLSERLQLAQSSITELIDRAVSCGLVVREPSPRDGRISLVRLTREGERRFALVFASPAQDQTRTGAGELAR